MSVLDCIVALTLSARSSAELLGQKKIALFELGLQLQLQGEGMGRLGLRCSR